MRLIRVEWPADAGAAAVWERLRQEAPTESLFLTPEWLQAWSRHLGDGRPVVFGVADDERGVVAVAPFQRVWVGGLTVLRPLGTGVSDYLDLLLPADAGLRRAALGVLVEALLARADAWDAVDLRGVPAESPTVAEVAAIFEERGLRCAVLPGYSRPAIALEGTWEAYLGERPGRFRYNLRSRLRRLQERGEARFRSVARPREVPAALRALVELHARRWAGQHSGTIFSASKDGRRFYADVLPQYAARGLLDLTLLEVGGQPVAGSVGFVDRDTYYYYLPAWDPSLAPLAPSSLLLAHLIERAYQRGLRRFDFMLGDEPYKARWATEERQTANLVLAAPSVRGQAAYAALVGWQTARRRARGSSTLRTVRRHWLGRAKSALAGAARASRAVARRRP